MSDKPKLPIECECAGWCCADIRSILDGNGHHPRCRHYVDHPEPSPKEARFGQLMWRYVLSHMPEFLGAEWSEDVMPLAEKAGLCRKEVYDPEKHGEDIDAEEGDEIWFWGQPMKEGGGQ